MLTTPKYTTEAIYYGAIAETSMYVEIKHFTVLVYDVSLYIIAANSHTIACEQNGSVAELLKKRSFRR